MRVVETHEGILMESKEEVGVARNKRFDKLHEGEGEEEEGERKAWWK